MMCLNIVIYTDLCGSQDIILYANLMAITNVAIMYSQQGHDEHFTTIKLSQSIVTIDLQARDPLHQIKYRCMVTTAQCYSCNRVFPSKWLSFWRVTSFRALVAPPCPFNLYKTPGLYSLRF